MKKLRFQTKLKRATHLLVIPLFIVLAFLLAINFRQQEILKQQDGLINSLELNNHELISRINQSDSAIKRLETSYNDYFSSTDSLSKTTADSYSIKINALLRIITTLQANIHFRDSLLLKWAPDSIQYLRLKHELLQPRIH